MASEQCEAKFTHGSWGKTRRCMRRGVIQEANRGDGKKDFVWHCRQHSYAEVDKRIVQRRARFKKGV